MKNNRLCMIVLTLVLCVLLFLERLTGGIWHAVLGLLLILFSVAHLCRNNGELRNGKLWVRIIDWALIGLLTLLFITGMLLHPLQGVLALKIVHKLSAVLFVLGVIVHIVQHKKAFTQTKK